MRLSVDRPPSVAAAPSAQARYWRRPRLETIGGLGLAIATSILVTGYSFNDLGIYLPMTLYLHDGSLAPGDPLVAHLLRMPYALYRAYALVWDQHLLFAFWLVLRAATVVAMYMLARQLVRDRLAAALAVSLMVFSLGTYGTLGLTQILLGEPVQYTVAVPLCLFALLAYLVRRIVLSFFLIALAVDMQPILGFNAAALVIASLLLDTWRGRTVVPARRIGTAAVVGLIVSLPALLFTIGKVGDASGMATMDFLTMVRFGAFFHVLPSTFPRTEYVNVAVLAAFTGLGLLEPTLRAARRTLLVWLGVVLVVCVAGFFFSEIRPVPLFMQVMPFRSTLFFKVIGLICTGAYISAVIVRHRVLGWLVALLILIGMTLFYEAAVAGLALALALEATRLVRGRQPGARVVEGPVRRYFSRLLVVLPSVIFLASLPYRLEIVRIPGDPPQSALEAAADWARANTPREAVFVTPPDADMRQFTLFAERSTLGDTKLAGQALFDPGYGRVLYERLADLGCSVPDGPWCVPNTYATMPTQRFLELSQKYGACYALTRADHTLDLPEVYENPSFHVWALCSS